MARAAFAGVIQVGHRLPALWRRGPLVSCRFVASGRAARHGHDHGHAHSSHVLAEAGWNSEASRVTLLGAGLNIALAGGKGAVGVLAGSAALIADAGHSLTDLVSDGITLAALRISAQPPDRNHPYGHGRFETLASLGISGLLLTTAAGVTVHAFDMLTALITADVAIADHAHAAAATAGHAAAAPGDAWSAAEAARSATEPAAGPGPDVKAHSVAASSLSLLHAAAGHHDVPYGYAVGMGVASLAGKEAMFRWTMRVARRTGSDVLVANAWHHRSDALSSVVALVGIGGSAMGVPYLDPLAGLAVAAMIGHTGVKLAAKSARQLSDEVDPELTRGVALALSGIPGVSSCSYVRARPVGAQCVVDAHIELADAHASLSAAHQLAERARHSVLAEFEDVLDVAVHVRPRSGARSARRTAYRPTGSLPRSDAPPLPARRAPPTPVGTPPRRDRPSPRQDGAQGREIDAPPPLPLPLQDLHRPQHDIELDVRRKLRQHPEIWSVTHMSVHFAPRGVVVEVSVDIPDDLRISDAHRIAQEARLAVLDVEDVIDADIHLELHDR